MHKYGCMHPMYPCTCEVGEAKRDIRAQLAALKKERDEYQSKLVDVTKERDELRAKLKECDKDLFHTERYIKELRDFLRSKGYDPDDPK